MQTRRVATRGIIFKNGKIFAQKLKSKTDPRAYWCMPGGGLDIGEELAVGLHREMIEETGIAPKIGRLLFIQQLSEDGIKEQLEFFFHIENADDYQTINLEDTSHGMIEIAQCGFIDPKVENILPAFLTTIDLQSYIDTVQPIFIWDELTA